MRELTTTDVIVRQQTGACTSRRPCIHRLRSNAMLQLGSLFVGERDRLCVIHR